MSSVALRPYRAGDEADIISLIVDIQNKEFNIPITAADQPDLAQIPTKYQAFWVATAEERIVGTIGLIDCGDGIGAIRKMFVHADWRGRTHAVAARLLALLVAEAQRLDLHTLCLGTIDRLAAAQRFYEKHGFVAIDRAQLPPQFPIMRVDNRFYQRQLEHPHKP
jgi:N-acetylglutamate synthase-like GNAT family acetyltransferase